MYYRDQHGLLAQCDVVREKLQNLLLTIVDKEGNSDETSQGTDSVITDDTTTVEERGEGDGGEEGEEGGKRSGTRSIRKSVQKIEEETATLRAEVDNSKYMYMYNYYNYNTCMQLNNCFACIISHDQRFVLFLTHF